jgi:periplasmic protein TonB
MHLNTKRRRFLSKHFFTRKGKSFCKSIIMNSTTILQSNLLDIIFENRNKEYGAYRLRKFYNNRLGMALLIMMSFVVLFSLFQNFWHSADVEIQKPYVFEIKENKTSNYESKTKAMLIPVKQNKQHIQKNIAGETTPVIVAETNINKSIASINHADASELVISGNDFLSGDQMGNGALIKGTDSQVKVEEKKEEKREIFPFADVMPQYPGGLKALIAFLKKNIHAPADIDEGREIAVKVQFVVNYNGQLQSFKVMETGGEVFDNEVLRVLKKMPLWIPGKSNGENVAVYYTVPVKFTSDLE